MRVISAILFSLFISALFISSVESEEGGTPYGDFCPKCGKYGVCENLLTMEESREAVEGYFENEGIGVGHVRGRGRFIKLELLRGKEVYDVILFDRKTGRMRSIY